MKPSQKSLINSLENANTPATLRDYQWAGVTGIEAFGDRCLLADDMGLGKTLQALHFIQRAKARGLGPCVVVCPAIVKYMWAREAMAQVGLTATVIEGRYKKGRTVDTADIYVVNYDIINGWDGWFAEIGVAVLVLDEAHNLCNPETTRSKAAARLAANPQVRSVVALTGTPLNNRASELWHILLLVRPDLYPSRLAYGYEFCEPKFEKGKWSYPGSRNPERLHQVLKDNVMIRRLKTDVALELPAKTRQVYTFPLSDPAEYKKAAEDVVLWLKKKSCLAAARASRNESLARFGELRRLAARLKAPAVLDWVGDAVDQVGKMVLFTCHDFMIQEVLKRWPGTPVIDGGVKAVDRQHRIDQFQRTDQPFIVGQVVAMGVGATLTAASHTVMLEMDLRPAIMVQAEDRTYRIGQTCPVWEYYAIGEGTIEERICRILQTKQDTISEIIDGGVDVYSLNIFDLLLEDMYGQA